MRIPFTKDDMRPAPSTTTTIGVAAMWHALHDDRVHS
jgi:hypothetical protein